MKQLKKYIRKWLEIPEKPKQSVGGQLQACYQHIDERVLAAKRDLQESINLAVGKLSTREALVTIPGVMEQLSKLSGRILLMEAELQGFLSAHIQETAKPNGKDRAR